MWDNAGEGSTRYVAYSDAHSQLLEQSYRTSGAKATTTLSLGKREYTVRKTRKGWVQEVGGQPELWRAVKRVQRDSGTTPTMAPTPATAPPSPLGSPNAAAASPSLLLQLRDEREARHRPAQGDAAPDISPPTAASSSSASPDAACPAVATQLQTLLPPLLMQQQRLGESARVLPFRLCAVRALPICAAPPPALWAPGPVCTPLLAIWTMIVPMQPSLCTSPVSAAATLRSSRRQVRSPTLAAAAVRVDGALRASVLAGDLRLTALPAGPPGGSEGAPGQSRVFAFVLAADCLLLQSASAKPTKELPHGGWRNPPRQKRALVQDHIDEPGACFARTAAGDTVALLQGETATAWSHEEAGAAAAPPGAEAL